MALLLLVGALLLVGLVAISSASIEYADWHYQNPWFHTRRHVVYLLFAVCAAAAAYRVPPAFWLSSGWVWLFAALALLILVLLPGIGREVNGSQRWLPLGPFTLQPSEFAKLAMVVYLAGYMVRREHEVRHQWQGFLKPMAVLFAATLLLMIEPDFGATVIVAASVFGMLFLAGVKLGHFLLVLLGALGALLVRSSKKFLSLLSMIALWSCALVNNLLTAGSKWNGLALAGVPAGRVSRNAA